MLRHYSGTAMMDKGRDDFVERLLWRTCTHRRVRTRPLSSDVLQAFEEEYCDLALDAVDPLEQWCRRDSCPYLHRQDVP